MRILAIGGAGYIGSVVVEHLLSAGHEVVVLDDFSTGHRAAVAADATLCVGDMCGPALDRALTSHAIDVVIHLAARSQVAESMARPGLYFDANVGGAVRLLEAMRRHGPMRLVFSSTAAVYGHPNTRRIREDTPCAPVNPYGESKWMVERVLRWFGEIHDLRWVALRYFNAAGATEEHGEDHRPESHLIPIALQVAAGQREELTVFGDDYPTEDRTCVRDYIHVLDLAEAHRLAAERLLARGAGEVFNLGGGRGRSVIEVVEAVRRVTGVELVTRVSERRPGDPAELVADWGRARAELAWEPRQSELETIVSAAWDWRRRHPGGYDA